jgi:hypothetical protein
MDPQATMSRDMQECIELCTFAHDACLDTVNYCLTKGGDHAEASHVRRLLDCAEICQTSANYMLRGSDLHVLTCAVCAEVCTRCADDCARFTGDEQMQMCADACRACAESCRKMSQAHRQAA